MLELFQVLGHCESPSSIASRSLVPALPHPADFSLLIGCEVHPGRGRAEHVTEGCKTALLNPAESSQKCSSGTSKCR